MTIGTVETPEFFPPATQIAGGEHPVFTFDRFPYFEREARHGHGLLIPMLLRLFVPLGAILRVTFANFLPALGDFFSESSCLGNFFFKQLGQLRVGGVWFRGLAL